MTEQRYNTLDRLIQQANRTVSRKPNSVQILAQMIRILGADGGDPYLILGALMEGAAHTLAKHVPAERQAAIVGQRSLLEAAVSAALPAPFASVASVADREGLG